MRVILLVGVTMVAFGTGIWSGIDDSPLAEAKCPPSRPPGQQLRYDGWWRVPDGATVGGVYAEMYNYDPYVYYTVYNLDVVGYVGLQGAGDYAIVGWQERAGNLRYSFGEYRKFDGTVVFTQYTTPEPQPENTFSFYTALYNNYAPGYVTFYIAGRLVHIIPPLGWAPDEGVLYGRTWDVASQMPGGINAPAVLRNADIYYSGSWRPFNGTAFNPYSNHHGNAGGVRTYFMWDKYCSL